MSFLLLRLRISTMPGDFFGFATKILKTWKASNWMAFVLPEESKGMGTGGEEKGKEEKNEAEASRGQDITDVSIETLLLLHLGDAANHCVCFCLTSEQVHHDFEIFRRIDILHHDREIAAVEQQLPEELEGLALGHIVA